VVSDATDIHTLITYTSHGRRARLLTHAHHLLDVRERERRRSSYLLIIFIDDERLGDVPASIYDIRRRRARHLHMVLSRVDTRQLAITLYLHPIERSLQEQLLVVLGNLR
jgi:hypothetical protein